MPGRSIAAVVLVVLVFYGVWKATPLLSGPVLHLESPAEGQSFADGAVVVSGVALHTEKLTLNGAPLLIDGSGNFATTLDMPTGGGILSLTVTDRFGRTHTEQRSVFVPLH
jgi:hypothetical protein